MIGQLLGHYRLLEHLGAGGMGVVYRARDERLDRDVAVKILHAGALADPDERRRFRREAAALSRLKHPNVTTLLDFDTDAGVDFIVMEKLEGETLARRLAGGPIDEPTILSHAIAVAEALEAAHAEGIIHRDLKPSNLQITPQGLKVVDFGLAKVETTLSRDRSDDLSMHFPVGGTLRYMAPEVVLGDEAGARSDLYSLGCVLYEMATGHAPFDAASRAALEREIVHRRVRTPRGWKGRISSRLRWIILRLLEKRPERRFSDASELLRELRRGAQAPSLGERVRFARARVRPRDVALAGVALVILGVATMAAFDREALLRWTGLGSVPVRSLAVLSIVNMSGDPDQEFLADGMTEELITQLSQVGALKVISRTSSMRFKGVKLSIRDIGRELGVDAVLEGSFSRAANRVQVTTRLVKVANEETIWAQTYDRDAESLSGLRAELALTIANELDARLSPAERNRLVRPHPIAPDAYDAFLKGRFFADKTHAVAQRRAGEYFAEAIRLQPGYAEAWGELADTYLSRVLYNDLAPDSGFALAAAAAERAIALDSTSTNVRVTLGKIRVLQRWDFPGAEQHLATAIRLAPRNPRALRAWSAHLMNMGRLEEAVAFARRSRDLDPLTIRTNQQLAFSLISAGRYDEAIKWANRTIELDSTWGDTRFGLASLYWAKGMRDESIRQYLKAMRLGGAPEWEMALAESAWRRDGPLAFWREELKQASPTKGNPVHWAEACVYLGDHDGAMRWLELAYQQRHQALLGIKMQADFAPLRGDPRFQALLRRIGLSGGRG